MNPKSIVAKIRIRECSNLVPRVELQIQEFERSGVSAKLIAKYATIAKELRK